MSMIDYPLSRLVGAVDAGATFTLKKGSLVGELVGELESRNGAHHAKVIGLDLATVASKLIVQWWTRGIPGVDAGVEDVRRSRSGELRPHQRAALGQLGASHGAAAARTSNTFFRATGCQCDYCSAFDYAKSAPAESVAAPKERPKHREEKPR